MTQRKNVDIRHIADLARLKLTDEEVTRFDSEIGAVLEYVELLSTVSVDGIEPTAHASPIVNVCRDDAEQPTQDKVSTMNNAPATIDEDYFQVPVVISPEMFGEG